MKWNDNGESTREYVCQVSDTTIKRIIMKQKCTVNDQNVYEFEYVFMRFDSVPMQISIEKFYPNDEYKIEKFSLFDLDSENRTVEYTGTFKNNDRVSLLDSIIQFECSFNFDSDWKMNIHSEFTHNFITIDSMKKDGLFINTNSTIKLTNLQEGSDSTYITKSSRIYAKGKGIIQFMEESGGISEVYKLNE